jgi:2-phospho-L-lactate guanylyltransferase
MTNTILAAIPIKPFGVAKRRLAGTLDASARSRLGRTIAARTAAAAADAGALVAVVTGDSGVATWAQARGLLVLAEDRGDRRGLDGAADVVIREAERAGSPWAVIHADLPLVTPADFRPLFELARSHTVLVPSYNGGTNVIAGPETEFTFSYGPSSFHRHIAANPHSVVRAHPHLALDLDTGTDLATALALPSGAWLRELID